jgi:uncharacterized metal-binding protein
MSYAKQALWKTNGVAFCVESKAGEAIFSHFLAF